jgi:hypothetical protein
VGNPKTGDKMALSEREKKYLRLKDKVGVSVRQLYNYTRGHPVPSSRVYYVKSALGGELELWIQPGRAKEKRKLFEEADI